MLLMTYEPNHIVEFCAKHPVDWKDNLREETRLGGAGDVKPPTPAADAFFKLLALRDGALFDQEEYDSYCTGHLWADWYQSLRPYVRICFSAKLYRNFFPSFIDSLHVWALLGTRCKANGQLVFDRCVIDTYKDVVRKTDLFAYRGKESIRIAITVDSMAGKTANRHKKDNRGRAERGIIEIAHSMQRQRGAGNKRWFHWPDDFKPIFAKVEQLFLFKPGEVSHVQ